MTDNAFSPEERAAVYRAIAEQLNDRRGFFDKAVAINRRVACVPEEELLILTRRITRHTFNF